MGYFVASMVKGGGVIGKTSAKPVLDIDTLMFSATSSTRACRYSSCSSVQTYCLRIFKSIWTCFTHSAACVARSGCG